MTAPRFVLTISGIALAVLVTLCLLPQDKYIRYYSVDIGATGKPQWMYERIHFDETPIDIAFFGTSHTLNGVDSEIVSDGLTERLGRPVVAANLAIPWIGRDMHLTLLRELLSARTPACVVLEVRELEARNAHRGNYLLADCDDLVTAPLVINPRYFANLARQPLRQLDLWGKTQFPGLRGASYDFDRDAYVGSHFNRTMRGSLRPRTDHMPREELVAEEKRIRSLFAGRYDRSNEWKNYYNFNFSHTNTRRFVEEARAAGAEVCFLYMPDFGSGAQPVAADFYESLAPIISPTLAPLYAGNNWWDNGHLNASGATMVSSELPEKLAPFLTSPDASGP